MIGVPPTLADGDTVIASGGRLQTTSERGAGLRVLVSSIVNLIKSGTTTRTKTLQDTDATLAELQTAQIFTVTQQFNAAEAIALGTAATAGNGLLQLASGTTKANGIAYGDTFLYRLAAGSIYQNGPAATDINFSISRSTGETFSILSGVSVCILGTISNTPLYFRTNNVIAVGIDTAQNVTISSTTDSTSTAAASISTAGGLGVVKRSFLGTIGASFAGNVLAGVQSGAAAVAGQVGERITSNVAGVALAATTTCGNITSISLTAGDWDISGFAVVAGGATGLTAGTTMQVSIVTTTATNGTAGSTMAQESVYALVANGLVSLSIPKVTANISATTTYYITAQATYAAGAPTASATITATRVR